MHFKRSNGHKRAMFQDLHDLNFTSDNRSNTDEIRNIAVNVYGNLGKKNIKCHVV